MKALVFDPKKHRYARLSDGSIEPLFYSGNEPRNFYKAEFGRWYLDFDRFYGAAICLMHLRIVEFLEERE